MKRETPSTSVGVITELGGTTKVSKMFSITPQAVSGWKRLGIPVYPAAILRERFPTLKAWQLADENTASAKDLPN